MKEFIIRPELRTVECNIKMDGGKVYTGVSKCHEGDVFNERVGKKLANLRATIKVRKDYLKDINADLKDVTEVLNEIVTEKKRVLKSIRSLNKDIERVSTTNHDIERGGAWGIKIAPKVG